MQHNINLNSPDITGLLERAIQEDYSLGDPTSSSLFKSGVKYCSPKEIPKLFIQSNLLTLLISYNAACQSFFILQKLGADVWLVISVSFT